VLRWLKASFERGLGLLRDRETGAFLTLAALVGVAVGLGAGLLVWALRSVEGVFAELNSLVGGGRWFVLISAPLGIVIAWWIARRFAREVAGDGVPEAVEALGVRGGYLSTRSIPLKVLATALTLGGGGSGGREGPIVQIGGAIGSSISRRFRLGEDQIRSLVAAGAGAGIGASFNAPIAGMLFALEVILGSFAVRHMSAIVIASVAAAVTFRSLPLGPEDLLRSKSYFMGDARELLLYAGLAVVAVLAAVLFLKLVDMIESRSENRFAGLPGWLRPVSFGVLVGVIGLVEPNVLGTGQSFVSELLFSEQFFTGGLGLVWYALIGLAIAKIVATALTITTGGSGGAFMPSLFIGATLGAGYARLIQPFWNVSLIEPGAFAVVGMATVFAAVARAPLTAVLIVFEVTQAREYRLILPLMLATTFATFVAERVHPESIYTMPLTRRGIKLVRTGEIDLLDTVSVGDVMVTPSAVATTLMTLSEASSLMAEHRYHGLPVIADRRLVGIITVTDINRMGGPSDDLRVSEAMTTKPATVGPDTPVSQALERMAVLGIGRLPVVAEEDPSRLVGMFRREEAVRAYHQALGSSTELHLTRERLRQRTEPGASYYDFRIPPGSIADGRAVKEITWPEGSTLVSVRRGTDVLIPTGGTGLRAGDIVTAFGTEASCRTMIERLNEGADEPTAEIVMLPEASEVEA